MVSAVCLTSYPKRSEMLSEALLSFQLQTYPQKELVIVNDGVRLRSVHPQCFVINMNGVATIGEKRNVALDASHGKYTCSFDDDDFSLPFRMEQQVGMLEDRRLSYIHSRRHYVANNQLRVVGSNGGGCYAASMHLTEEARAFGFPHRNYGEDFWLYFKLVTASGQSVEWVHDRTFYIYRRHALNVTTPQAGPESEYLKRVNMESPARLNALNGYLRTLLAGPRVRYVVPA